MKTHIKAKMSPVSFLTTLLFISINVNANNVANNTTHNIANNIVNHTANNTTHHTANNADNNIDHNTANNTVNNVANNTAHSTFVKTKTNTTKARLTTFDQQQPKTTLKMNYLGLTKEEIILSENLKAIALEMDKNNSLSSLEILGIFATTEQDKTKYARKFVASIRNYTTKVLAFQQYINQAHKHIAGSGSMFDYVPTTKAHPTSTKQKRISRTINLNDCDEMCEHDIKTWVQMPLIFPIDLYFNNDTKSISNTDIQQWALKMNLSRDAVKQGLITLNHAY